MVANTAMKHFMVTHVYYSMPHLWSQSYFFAETNLNESKRLNSQTRRCFTDLNAH